MSCDEAHGKNNETCHSVIKVIVGKSVFYNGLCEETDWKIIRDEEEQQQQQKEERQPPLKYLTERKIPPFY